MKFSTEQMLAAAAFLALGYVLGKRRGVNLQAQGAASLTAATDPVRPNEWWSYAGQWAM